MKTKITIQRDGKQMYPNQIVRIVGQASVSLGETFYRVSDKVSDKVVDELCQVRNYDVTVQV